MKQLTLIFALTLIVSVSMAQTDSTKISTRDTSHGSGIVVLDSISHLTSLTFPRTGIFSGIAFNGFTYDRVLDISYAHRAAWSVGKIDNRGNATVYVKRSMVHWINDSTMYISTKIIKHKKHRRYNGIRIIDRNGTGITYLGTASSKTIKK